MQTADNYTTIYFTFLNLNLITEKISLVIQYNFWMTNLFFTEHFTVAQFGLFGAYKFICIYVFNIYKKLLKYALFCQLKYIIKSTWFFYGQCCVDVETSINTIFMQTK